ncbi:hypothetical protein [Pseudonocardia sp. ICBG1293]|uniref:hypothetical protein n=1 Tax=Pseudonocardia sp. ICBG1293 TaxID=2844382 RepID=UPI001CC9EF27|nr:hypothetical protein [Pseudonocardia sp. ICBG1293]
MSQIHEHDYGYDLAHEMKVVARLPQQRRGSSRPLGVPAREMDPDTDLGHDMAHEF